MTAQEMARQREMEMSKKTVLGILKKNESKDFVQRILSPDKYPALENEDGTRSTQLMASGEVDDKFIVYPTIFYNSEKKELYKPEDPVGEALKTNNYIQFKTAEEADWFSKNYKLAMPNK